MTCTVVRSLPEEVWREFVERHPAGNIYHTSEMFEVYARAKGYRPALWASVDDAGCPLALLLPVEITLLEGLLRSLTTRAVVYGSVLAASGSQGQAALATLLQAYRRATRGVLFTELRNLSALPEVQPILAAHHFPYEGQLNYLIDLSAPEEVLWRKMAKSGQHRVRTSHNKGTAVSEVTDKTQLAQAYRLLQKTYARVQVPLADLSLFEAAFDILGPRGMFKAFLAQADGQILGADLLLADHGRVVDWYAAIDRQFAAYAPMEALTWHAICWGKEHGFRLFDFGGAGRPGEEYGPRKFKAKFGGELVDLGRNVCVHAPLSMWLSLHGYQLLRRFL